MEGLQATSIRAFPALPDRRFLSKLPNRKSAGSTRKVVVRTRRSEMDGRDYSGKQVDESMIVLRMRIREMSHADALPSSWMEWEKKYYEHYNEDVCEAVGLLQSVLMNTRPCLALGMAVLLSLSLPISTFFALFQAIEMGKGVLSWVFF